MNEIAATEPGRAQPTKQQQQQQQQQSTAAAGTGKRRFNKGRKMRFRSSLFRAAAAAAAAAALLLPAALAIKLQLDSTPQEPTPLAAAAAAADAAAEAAAEALGLAAAAQQQNESDTAAAAAAAAAVGAQLYATAAEAAAAAADPAAAHRFAAAAAAAADAAADIEEQQEAAAAEEREKNQPYGFSLFLISLIKPLKLITSNSSSSNSSSSNSSSSSSESSRKIQPFDNLSCSDLQENLSLCVEHPRCSVNPAAAAAAAAAGEGSGGFKGQQPSCGLSKGYLSLAASGALCHLTAAAAAAAAAAAGAAGAAAGGRQSVAVSEGEMRAVVRDLMEELGIESEPLFEALKANDAADADSLCELAQELSSEVLSTERMTVESLRAATVLRASSESSGDAPIRIGINGFGRIGRLVFRIASSRPDMAVTHINSSMSPEYLSYALKYDSAHGRFDGNVEVQGNALFVDGRRIHLTAERDPKNINWKESKTDFVCESTGAFCTLQGAGQHVDRPGGARHAIISAPAKDEETPTLVVGVNAEAAYTPEMRVVSCASCTTNGLAPLVKVIDKHFGIEEGLMTTVHAVTGTQRVVDMTSNKDWRGGRAAGFNIIPSSTGAAKAVARCLPQMKGRLTGMAFRVPTLDVSVVDLTCRLNKSSNYEEIKAAVKAAAEGELKGIIGYTEDPIVSSDVVGSECSTVFDANAGIMLNPNFVKLISWYDNEYAYSARLVDLIAIMAAKDGLVPYGTGLQRKPF
ncbi:hypothetical protein Emag_000925 [Eimeria magna]